MDSNIKVINQNLWIVNFDYIIQNNIDNILISKISTEDEVTIGINTKKNNECIIIFNSNSPYYLKKVAMFEYIMSLNTNQLGNMNTFKKYVNKFFKNNKIETLNSLIYNEYLTICKFELMRRNYMC